MFCEAESFEALVNGFKDDLLEGASCVFAELARVRVVTVRHYSYILKGLHLSRLVDKW